MKKQFYPALIAAGLLAGACSPSKTSDPEVQVIENSQDATVEIEGSSTSTDQNFKSSEELSLQGITFNITASNEQPTNSVIVSTKGLEVSNDAQTIEIAGGLLKAEVEDMNSDGSPELILFFNSYGLEPEEFAIVFSVNNLKSLSRVSIPPLTAEQEIGYQGGGEIATIDTKLIRKFPIYVQQGENWMKTEKTRQLQYSLQDGEAMRQFILDKVTEF